MMHDSTGHIQSVSDTLTSHIAGTVAGTLVGTAVAVSAIPSSATIYTTMILASIGAGTSFLVTVGVKYVWYKYLFPEKKGK